MDTVLDTGPGVWEERAHSDKPVKRKNVVKLVKALPSLTHMGIVKLHEESLVKFTVSQNVDGLHRRSGLGSHELSELHGNTNLEQCRKCKRQYMRDFETRCVDISNLNAFVSCDDHKEKHLEYTIIRHLASVMIQTAEENFMTPSSTLEKICQQKNLTRPSLMLIRYLKK